MLCRDLGFPETQAPVLSDVMRSVPGCCSLARENEIRVALGLQPRTRRRYLRPCLSLDPTVRAGQLRALLAAAEAAMETPDEGMMTNTIQVDRLLAESAKLRAEIAKLRAALALQPDAATATPNQTYIGLPGDAWSRYTAATDDSQHIMDARDLGY